MQRPGIAGCPLGSQRSCFARLCLTWAPAPFLAPFCRCARPSLRSMPGTDTSRCTTDTPTCWAWGTRARGGCPSSTATFTCSSLLFRSPSSPHWWLLVSTPGPGSGVPREGLGFSFLLSLLGSWGLLVEEVRGPESRWDRSFLGQLVERALDPGPRLAPPLTAW